MFIDTSGFYSLYNNDQNDHQAAIEHYGSASSRVTTNYVLAEYVALADARGSSRSDAIGFSRQVLDDSEIDLIWVDEDVHRRSSSVVVRTTR